MPGMIFLDIWTTHIYYAQTHCQQVGRGLDYNCLKESQDTKRANKEQLNLTPSDDFAGAVFGLSDACKQNMKYKKLLQMSNEKLI